MGTLGHVRQILPKNDGPPVVELVALSEALRLRQPVQALIRPRVGIVAQMRHARALCAHIHRGQDTFVGTTSNPEITDFQCDEEFQELCERPAAASS